MPPKFGVEMHENDFETSHGNFVYGDGTTPHIGMITDRLMLEKERHNA